MRPSATSPPSSPGARATVHPLAVLAAFLCMATASSARSEDPVAVLVTGPLAAKVGDRVSFEVELVNRSGRPLEKLRVIDYFDRGFHHEASASPIEQKGTVDLAAGTSRRLTLDFLLDEPGRQCHRVEILDQAHTFMGGATSCVQVAAAPIAAAPLAAPTTTFPSAPPIETPPPATTYPPPLAASASPQPVPPAMPAAAPLAPAAALAPAAPLAAALPLAAAPAVAAAPFPASAPPAMAAASSLAVPASPPALELDLVGPVEVVPGATAEFFATVRNIGAVPSGQTNLDFSWDDAFTPQEASDGYKLASSRVSWDMPPIEPGGQARRQINLKAQPVPAGGSARSCVRAVLSGAVGGVMVADESCVLIRSTAPRPRTPREAGIRLTLADCDDPVLVGQPTSLVCAVVNGGSTASGKLDVTIMLPERATLVGDPRPSRWRIDGSNVTFDGIPSIPAGGQAIVELSYRTPAPGPAKATAIITGSELDGSLDSNCLTTFLAP
jgi:hypothetical protein